MIPLGLGAIFLGREATIVFFTIVAIFGFKEFARATGLYHDWWMTGAVYLGIIAVGVISLVPRSVPDVPGWYGLFMALPVYVDRRSSWSSRSCATASEGQLQAAGAGDRRLRLPRLDVRPSGVPGQRRGTPTATCSTCCSPWS